jgi:hypothetical protein
MTAAVHNGETFLANDEILVCAHGGEYDATLRPPSSGTSGNEILYTGVPNGPDIPTFDDGYDGNSQDFLLVQGIAFQPGVSESGIATFEGGRFADATRSWQAAEETAIDNWDQDSTGIFAVGIGATGGGVTATPQLYWRDKTDAGSFAAVGAAGEVKYTTVSGLTDESDVTSGEMGTSSGKAAITCNTCEQENSHQATSSTSIATDEYAELQVGVSLADADADHEYEFALYESAAQVGSASVTTITTKSDCEEAGCSGTYLFCWTGEHPSGSGYACYNSGSSSANLLGQNAGTIAAGGAINGSNGILIDNIADYIYWTTPSATLDATGTARVLITSPGTLGADTHGLFRIYSEFQTGDNNIELYIADTGKDSKGRHKANALNETVQSSTLEMAAATTYTLCYTWTAAGGGHAVSVYQGDDPDCSEGTWDYNGGSLGTFAADGENTDFVGAGNDCDAGGGSGGCHTEAYGVTYKVDDIYFYSDYKGP